MAEKRYYWLKLKDDYFTNPKIKKLRKIAGGDTFTIIYLKMQLLSISNKGIIEFEGIENTIEEELSLKLDEQLEDVQLTMAYLQNQGLVESDNNKFMLTEACENIGSEVDSAERVRNFRERKKQKMLQEPKSNAVRQRQFRAKEICKKSQHIPMIEDYINNKRYNGNYYLVFKRDEMKCVICGEIENLCVHHIDGYDENKPQNSNENKMITLCRECHSKVHSQSIDIPKLKLESIGYFDECNESNEMCNDSVTEEKQTSISNISYLNSISNNIENKKENITKENSISETSTIPNVNIGSENMFGIENASPSSKSSCTNEGKTAYSFNQPIQEQQTITVDSGKEIISFILKDNSIYSITESEYNEFSEAYPSIDIMQELRKLRAWCMSNPSKRKTRRGALKFVNNWLSNAQEKIKAYSNTSYDSAKKNIQTQKVETKELQEGLFTFSQKR